MTFADLHTRAILPLVFTVCGVRLMPLTVGHVRILDALELWDAVTPDELVLAAWICSRPARETAEGIHGGSMRWRLPLWRWRLGRNWNWAKSAITWGEYVAHHMEEAAATFRASKGTSVMPLTARLRVVLCNRCGYKPETFDDAPIAQALIDYQALGEAEDALNLSPCTVTELREAVASLRGN